MLLRRIDIDGLRHARVIEHELDGPVHHLPGTPAGTAVADAISLVRASLDPEVALQELGYLGLLGPTPELELDGALLSTVQGLDPAAVASMVADGAHRRVVCEIQVNPDPLLFRQLKDQAPKNPRMVAALSSGGTLKVRVGWLFTRSGTSASVDLLGFKVGDVKFSLDPTERPNWLPDVLKDTGARLARVHHDLSLHDIAEHFLDAATSPHRELRERYAQAVTALAAEPLHLGEIRLVRRDGRAQLCFGDHLVPARAYGPAALEGLRAICVGVILAPDVLVIERVDPAHDPVVAHLSPFLEGDDATLEQLVVIGGRQG